MADEIVTVAPADPVPVAVVRADTHEKETILRILGALAGICVFGLVVIGAFSIWLQTMQPPREAGSSVGALRENIMSVLSAIVGALIMKAKASG